MAQARSCIIHLANAFDRSGCTSQRLKVKEGIQQSKKAAPAARGSSHSCSEGMAKEEGQADGDCSALPTLSERGCDLRSSSVSLATFSPYVIRKDKKANKHNINNHHHHP